MRLYKTKSRQRVRNHLRQQIVGGKLLPGDQLLPERELCRVYKASRTMIRAILVEFEEEKLIERKQGNGTFVTGLNSSASDGSPVSEKPAFSSEEYFSFYPKIRTKLKFHTMDYHPLQKQFWGRIVRDFSKTAPMIEVVPCFGDEVSPDNALSILAEYDVVQRAPLPSEMLSESHLVDLRRLVERDNICLDAYQPAAARPFIRNEHVWALPFSLGITGLLFINEKLAEKAHAGIPDSFSSLEHFFKWCSVLTAGLNGRDPFNSAWATNLHNYPFYYPSDLSMGFYIKNPLDISALKARLNLILKYRRKAYSGAYEYRELYRQFLRGDIAVFPGSTLELMFMKEAADFPWTIRAMSMQEGAGYNTAPIVNCLSSASRHKEEAWEFIRYLSSPAAQHMIAEEHINMPSLNEAFCSEAYLTKDVLWKNALLQLKDNAEEVKAYGLADAVPPRLRALWLKVFKENLPDEGILSEIVGLAEEINRNNRSNSNNNGER